MNFSGSLSKYILENTTEQIFWRGVEYANKGRVRNVRETNKVLQAAVRGSQPYEVEFRQGPKYVKGYCVCPYALNEDYCKHVVALAAHWDTERGVALPEEKEVADLCVEVEYGFDKKVEQMYRDPLHADLAFLASATDYSSWVRPHSRIQLVSPVEESQKPISAKEARTVLQKIARLANRSAYDPYFCAGEISAVLSLALDAILKRLEHTPDDAYLDVMAECIEFYYNMYLQMIDGSEGVWQIPLVRLQAMMSDMGSRQVSREQQEELRTLLNSRIQGWGDVFEDLQVQFS